MIPMGINDDEWIAAVASYVRRSFGNTGGFVTPADVARVRAGNRRPQDDVDGSGADRVAAGAAVHGRLEGDGEPQRRRGERRADADDVERRRAATGRACGSRSSCRNRRPSRRSSSSRRRQAAVAGAGHAAALDVGRRADCAAHPGSRADTRSKSRQTARPGRLSPRERATADTIITFPPVQAKFVRISLTTSAEDAPAWSIQNLRIYALQQPEKRTSAPAGRP